MKKQNIYLIGIFILGVAYPGIKNVIGGGVVFVGLMLCIALLIAWVAHRFGR